jgi:hypothetical protein
VYTQVTDKIVLPIVLSPNPSPKKRGDNRRVQFGYNICLIHNQKQPSVATPSPSERVKGEDKKDVGTQ